MVVDSKLYDLLKVAPDASPQAIKKAYRELVKIHHPDKGGDEEIFKEIDAAYKVLSDPEMREMYDATGSVEANAAGLGGADFDILSHLFSGGFEGFGMPGMNMFNNGRKKTPDVLHEIHLSLDTIYKGCKKIIAVKRTIICTDCKGQGGSDPKTCSPCRGMGMVLVQQQNGPFIMQTQQGCTACKGSGKQHEEGKKCTSCDTSGYTKTKTTVEIVVPPGVPNGYTLIKKNMADEKVGFETGDLHVRIRETQHAAFTRTGADLHTKVPIDLPTALVGGIVQFPHIDGRMLSVTLPKGKVTRYGDTVSVSGKGMPKFPAEDKSSYGDLRITFHVEMPSDAWAVKINESVVRRLFA